MLHDSLPLGDTPSIEEAFPPALNISEHAELLAWYAATEAEYTDYELDAMWAEEMVRRDECEKASAADAA